MAGLCAMVLSLASGCDEGGAEPGLGTVQPAARGSDGGRATGRTSRPRTASASTSPRTRPRSRDAGAAPPFRRDALSTLQAPTQPACTFVTADWSAPQGYRAALHIHRKAPPFAYLRSGALRLLIPAGAGEDAVVEVQRDALRLTAFVRADSTDSRLPLRRRPASQRPFVLRPARALSLGGVAVVTAEAVLSWHAASPGQLAVTLPDAPIRWEAGAHVEVSCSDLSLDPAAFDHRPLLPEAPGEAPERHLQLGRRIRIARSATAKPMAWLWLAGGDDRVVELERTERRVRILAESDHYAVFGWVKRSDLVRDDLAPLLGAAGLGLEGLSDRGWGPLPAMHTDLAECRCPNETPVVVDMATRAPHAKEYDANYAIVGSLSRRQPFRVRRRAHGLSELWLAKPPAGLSMARGKLTVPSEALEPCECSPLR